MKLSTIYLTKIRKSVMSILTRIFLVLCGLFFILVGVFLIWTPYPNSVGVLGGIIAFICGGGLLGIAIFYEGRLQ